MLMKLNQIKNEKGFTLIELLIVVAIIGILAAIAIPQFTNYRKNAANNAARMQVAAIKSKLDAVYADQGSYNDTSITFDTNSFGGTFSTSATNYTIILTSKKLADGTAYTATPSTSPQ